MRSCSVSTFDTVFVLQAVVCRTQSGNVLRRTVVIPDTSISFVRELAAAEHLPLELVRVYLEGAQLKHDLTPADSVCRGSEPGTSSASLWSRSLALSMKTAIQVLVVPISLT